MSQRGVLIGLLVLASVLVDCAVVTVAARESESLFGPMLAWALQRSQVSMAAIWLALGKTWGSLRLTGVVVVVAFWSCAMTVLAFGVQLEEWMMVLVAQTFAVSLPLLVARCLGAKLEATPPTLKSDKPATGPRTWQFSIAYLLTWMTALAFALGTMQYIAPYRGVQFGLLLLPLGFLLQWRVGVLVLGSAVVALSALWRVLGSGEPAVRTTVLCVVAAMVILAAFFLGPFPRTEGPLVLVLLEVLLLLGSLAVFRVAGYRLRVGRRR